MRRLGLALLGLCALIGEATAQAPTIQWCPTGTIPPFAPCSATNPFYSALAAATTGGCTPAKTLSAASNNSTSIKATAGTLCKLIVINTTTTLYYLKFYDKATAPTCASDTVVATYAIPYGASNAGGGIAIPLGPSGEAYAAGIGFCLVAGIADNDNTSAATGVTISYSYK